MACKSWETVFESDQTVVVSVSKYNHDVHVEIENRGCNAVRIYRLIVGWENDDGYSGAVYVREPGTSLVTWEYGSPELETGIRATFYTMSARGMKTAQAQVEYVEIDGRSRSCRYSV